MKEKIDIIKSNKLVILFFILLFFIGLFTFKDYGFSLDEYMQRNHSMRNYREYLRVVEKTTGIAIDDIRKTPEYDYLGMGDKIENFIYKYYGVGIQLPLVIIEQLTKFNMDISTVYYIRHLYTFIIYFISMIYFYLILKKYIIKDKKYALIGTIFLVISPRIYGDAFYNIKDLVFMSLCIINSYYCMKFLENDKLKNIIKLSIITALTVNSRIIGAIIIFICFIMKILINRKQIKKALIKLLQVFIFTYICYFIITPIMWNDPIMCPFKILDFFFNYKDPLSNYIQQNYYLGKNILSTKLPWHYILLWIFITTPIIYTALSFIGSIKLVSIIKSKKRKININILFTNIILFLILLLVVVIRPTMYGGWRHFYWLYPLIIVNSIIGLKYIINKFKKQKVIIITMILISLLSNIVWMIINHPYQYNYFNPVTRKWAVKNFEYNYYKIPNTEALEYIAKIDKSNKIFVQSNYNYRCFVLLKKKYRKRIEVEIPSDNLIYNEDSNPNYDYIIDSNPYSSNNKKKDYIKIKQKEMDGVILYTIYKHK